MIGTEKQDLQHIVLRYPWSTPIQPWFDLRSSDLVLRPCPREILLELEHPGLAPWLWLLPIEPPFLYVLCLPQDHLGCNTDTYVKWQVS